MEFWFNPSTGRSKRRQASTGDTPPEANADAEADSTDDVREASPIDTAHTRTHSAATHTSLASPPTPFLLGWGPGDRRGLWAAVKRGVQRMPGVTLRQYENEVLAQLAAGKKWMAWVDRDHVAIYESIYDERKDDKSNDAFRIEKDVPRTFRVFLEDNWIAKLGHDVFARKERLATLTRLLNLGALTTDGYCQGMNFIAGLLMLQVPSEREAFVLLAWILRQLHLAALYSGTGYGLVLYTRRFEQMVQEHLPHVHEYFVDVGFTAVMYSVEWFTTLFSISCSKLLALAVMDLFFADVDDILLRVGIAILQMVDSQIVGLDFEELHSVFKKLVWKLPAEKVIATALAVSVPEGSKSLWEAERGQDDVPSADRVSPPPAQLAAAASSLAQKAHALIDEHRSPSDGGEAEVREVMEEEVHTGGSDGGGGGGGDGHDAIDTASHGGVVV